MKTTNATFGMNRKKNDNTCGTCVWFDRSYEVCVNGYSEYRADFRLETDKCEMHERRIKDVESSTL